jgi:hypothetical protein
MKPIVDGMPASFKAADLMKVQDAPFTRRLRLLLAQEFAARGYYLDAESFYLHVPEHELGTNDLELLIKTAVARQDHQLTETRLERLKKTCPSSELLQGGDLLGRCRPRQKWWHWLMPKT